MWMGRGDFIPLLYYFNICHRVTFELRLYCIYVISDGNRPWPKTVTNLSITHQIALICCIPTF